MGAYLTTALITGATGFVGSNLAEYLITKTNWDIVGMIRWRSPLDNISSLISLANEGKRIRFVYADLRDTLAVQKAVEDAAPDYVYHLAAQSYPLTSFTSPLDTLDTNIQGTVKLLEALKTSKAIIHVCSSSEVYGKTSRKYLPIKEDCPFQPASPYAVSKVGCDLMAQHYAEAYGMNIQITRMFTHTGPRRGDVFMESSFAKQIAMIEAGMIPPVVKVGNLKSLRTIADVRDAVRAYYMLLTVNPQSGAVYNIGGNHSCTVGDILDTLMGMSDTKMTVEQDPERMRPIDADLQVPDCNKFKKHTGWEPIISFEQTIQDLLNYWRLQIKQTIPLQR